MTVPEILKTRLHNLLLDAPVDRSPAAIAAHLCALQAQDYAAAKWSIGLRGKNLTDADVEKAIADKSLVRAYSLRSTMHFMHRDDVRWITRLSRERMMISNAAALKKMNLDEKLIGRSNTVIYDSLQGGKELTRDELKAALEKKKIAPESQQMNNLLYRAGLDEVICCGQRRGKEFTYALMDDYIPPARKIKAPEALSMLAKRYFSSHGPATVHDFSWWCGHTISDCKQAVQSLGNSLQQFSHDKQDYYMGPGEQTTAISSKPLLIPGFDEYYIGYTNRSLTTGAVHAKQLSPPNGLLPYLVIIKGKVAGTYRRTVKKKDIEMTFVPFESFSDSQKRSLEKACGLFSRFMELPISSITF